MKKTLLLLSLLTLTFAGCTQEVTPTDTEISDSDLLRTQITAKPLSAADVDNTTTYNFAILDEPSEEIPTFKKTDSLSITTNDSQLYSLYYSEIKDYNIENLEPITFDTYYKIEKPSVGYYTLSTEQNIDATVSTY